MNRFLPVLLVCLLVAGSAIAGETKSKPLERPKDPYEWQFPSLVNGKPETRTIRSFLVNPHLKNIVFIVETEVCDMCDRAAPSNRTLAKSVRISDGIIFHVLYGTPANLSALLEKRVYDSPVLFDLDGAFTRTLGVNPSEAPMYVVADEKENIVSMMSGLKVNPATIQLSILAALMVKKTQGLVDESKPKAGKPATP